MRFAIVGDIHSNAEALRSTLDWVSSSQADRVVLMGDLFTYGTDPVGTYNLVAEIVKNPSVVLLAGNHDWMYLSQSTAAKEYFESLPDWIRESVSWTRKELEGCSYEQLPWRKNFTEAGTLFSHANPYAFGDWSYLNSEEDLITAAISLRDQGFSAGVFGHTHRQKAATVSMVDFTVTTTSTNVVVENSATSISLFNAGSPGQPRNAGKEACVLILETSVETTSCDFLPVVYDLGNLQRSILSSGLSQKTQKKLLGYY